MSIISAIEDVLGRLIGERPYHDSIIATAVIARPRKI